MGIPGEEGFEPCSSWSSRPVVGPPP